MPYSAVTRPGGVIRLSMKPCRGFDSGSNMRPKIALESPDQGAFTLMGR